MADQFDVSREQVRAIDRIAIENYGIPSIVLMENAGRGCADLLISQGISPLSPVIICCGKGNNAGDGLVMARHLEVQGYPVEILLFTDPAELKGDAGINYRIVSHSDIPIHRLTLPADAALLKHHLSRASWVVDALLGTGSTGEVRPPFNDVIHAINESQRPVFAIDLPSGLDCDLGDPVECCVRANVTGTLLAPKIGFNSETGKEMTGQIHVVPLGIPRSVLTALFGEVL